VGLGFGVEEGELWLDLGANIGAFALYCRSLGAKAECYEPDPKCFRLLRLNIPEFCCRRFAITNLHKSSLQFYKGRRETDFSRATIVKGNLPEHPSGRLPNLHANFFAGRIFDGVKMDVEGSEFGLLDDELIPCCNKLVMEYHFSREKKAGVKNVMRRLEYLKRCFNNVFYPPEFDRGAAGGKFNPHFDRFIFCWNANRNSA
jgi:FkbM family methyltransferase